jgi:alkanesulfonate monooxygenase SsuD/methylene tetrahydromethanopterin reductase-like flavin-dependent oxidoreductase (luciferase family)
MRFAHFAHVWGKAGMTPTQRYDQLWRELALADELGFDWGFSVEHHFCKRESWMSSPNLYAVAAAARTKRIKLGAMGHVVPLHHPVRLLEEIALADQITGGRTEVGLVPGIVQHYFGPYGADFMTRREITLEFARFMKAAYSNGESFSWDGNRIKVKDMSISVPPVQRPYPPMWMETRDPPTLEFCAKEGIHTGYFLLFPRVEAKKRYGTYLENWKAAGHKGTPNIAYSTVVFVAESDQQALDIALEDAGQAYKGFFSVSADPAEIKQKQREMYEYFKTRNEPGAADIVYNLIDPEYLLKNDLILLGSPKTVTEKLRAWAEQGRFNSFFGEFNFGQIKEDDLMRSIRLFGAEVMPKLRSYEPF